MSSPSKQSTLPTSTVSDTVVTVALEAVVQGRRFWASRTFWVNTVAAVALVAQARWGFIIGVETQAVLLSLINIGLRAITREPLTWN